MQVKSTFRPLRFRAIESLEARLNLCVTTFAGGEFVELCVPELPEPAPIQVQRAADAINDFAFDLYQHYLDEEGNVFLSPFSISTALAMAYAGAESQTAAEMEDVLHFGSESGIHDSFRELLEFRAGPTISNLAFDFGFYPRSFDLQLANALWPDQDIAIRGAFVDQLMSDYDASVQALDYSNTEEARNTINGWVADKTQNTVPELLKTLSPATRLVLTNAAYFNTRWAVPFDPGVTRDGPFESKAGVVQVPMMYNNEGEFRYTEIVGFQVLELPYLNADSSMIMLLPMEGHSTEDLTTSVLVEVNTWLDSRPEPQVVDIKIPRFDTSVASDLQLLLGDMGMPSAFDAGADFSKIAPGLFISDVQHEAFVEVNEQGTTAGAATAILFTICFAKGTPIMTSNGAKPIEQLRAGDVVLARDENNVEAAIESKTIEETFENRSEIIELIVNGQTLRTTSEHPFFVQGAGWTPAQHLKPGDLLASDTNAWYAVESVASTGEEQTTYNFRVSDHHTYFVGSPDWGFAVWTHNRCSPADVQFNADHPFHFLIRDNATRTTLFMGRIDDPSQATNSLMPRAESTPSRRPGDADGDDDVDFADFLILSANFGRTNAVWADGDLTGDGNVTFEDFLILSDNFGNRRLVSESAAIQKTSATDDFFSRHDDESLLEDGFRLDGFATLGDSKRDPL